MKVGSECGSETFVKRLVRWIGNGICVISILIILSVTAMFLFHIKPVIVVSGSMEPVMETGSLALINTRDLDVEEGEVIAFERGDILVTHRAVRETEGGWITKGDNNDCEDPGVVSKDSIRGTTFLWLPKVGYVLEAFRPLR